MSINVHSRIGMTVLTALVLAGAAVWTMPDNAQAADNRLTVTLPTFQVILNGQTVDNRNREYPLIVYKDITYFPMTWSDCRFLGLENAWSPEQGLSIQQSNITSPYHDYASAEANSSRNYPAELAEGAVAVNGQSIDNASEEYPLLSFRDITYFPLTWRFAHDAFGWEYSWGESDGLSIRSANPQVKDAGLPGYAADNSFAVHKNYYYFAETDGTLNHIYRSPVSDPGAREHVYEYEYNTEHSPNNRFNFSLHDDGLWLSYHMGGGIMGHDQYVKLNEDGTADKGPRGYVDFNSTSLGQVMVDYGVPPGRNNLSLLPPEGGASPENPYGASISDPTMIYGWTIANTLQAGTSYSKGDLEVAGTSVYILASPYSVSTATLADANRIWRVDLKNGKQTAVSQEPVSKFKVTDKRILYVKSSDGLLYTSNLEGEQETLLSGQHKVYEFNQSEGPVFFTVMEDGWLYRLYRTERGKKAEAVSDSAFSAVYFTEDRILAQTTGDMPTLNIYDSYGKLLTRIEGQAESVYTDGDQLMLKLAGEVSLKVFQL